jgi:hypothetical protein
MCSEIAANVTGVLPQSDADSSMCLCSETYPAEEPDSVTYCISNDDLITFRQRDSLAGNPISMVGLPRLGPGFNLSLPEYILDDNAATSWQSAPGVSYVKITLPFIGLRLVCTVFDLCFVYRVILLVLTIEKWGVAGISNMIGRFIVYLSTNPYSRERENHASFFLSI